jgi:hypothetical protein
MLEISEGGESHNTTLLLLLGITLRNGSVGGGRGRRWEPLRRCGCLVGWGDYAEYLALLPPPRPYSNVRVFPGNDTVDPIVHILRMPNKDDGSDDDNDEDGGGGGQNEHGDGTLTSYAAAGHTASRGT